MTTKLTKGAFCTYTVRKLTVRAIVRRAHRDGSFTVEARHVLDAKGEPHGCYLGFKYRMHPCDLKPEAA